MAAILLCTLSIASQLTGPEASAKAVDIRAVLRDFWPRRLGKGRHAVIIDAKMCRHFSLLLRFGRRISCVFLTMNALAIAIVIGFAVPGDAASAPLNPSLASYVSVRVSEFDRISEACKQELAVIAEHARRQLAAGGTVQLVFICTHNSRRSQLAQIWAKTAADYYGLKGVETYSGGTETTAFNPRAVAALRRAGFRISTIDSSSDANPRYLVSA